MPNLRRTRLVVASALSCALAASGVLVGVGLAGGSGGKTPDLYPSLPSNHSNVNSRWVDTVEASGRVLYRFDTVIHNKSGAGALDVFRVNSTGDMIQAFWTTGAPPGAVTKDTPLPTEQAGVVNFAPIPGQRITYSDSAGHLHFHAPLVAKYSLLRMDSTPVAEAAKNSAGFCLYDSWAGDGTARFADGGLCRPGQKTWTGAVRMGISPGYGDFYGSQLGDQWIDVTAAVPGQYRLRAEVDPSRIYGEAASATGNNTLTETVTIPGAVVNTPAQVSIGHAMTAQVQLSGTVVGAAVKSRLKNPPSGCGIADLCGMTTAHATRIDYSLVSAPPSAAGTASVTTGGLVTFQAKPGFGGTVTFTVRGVDSRGLGGAPVTVRVNVAGPEQVVVTVSPGEASVETESQVGFSAGLENAAGPLSWSVNGTPGGSAALGTVTADGVYTAPANVPNGGAVTVQATHPASGASDSAQVTVTQRPLPPEVNIALTPGSIELAPGASQEFIVQSSGVEDPLEWSVDGVAGGDGTVGTVTAAGVYTAPAQAPQHAVVIRATDLESGVSGQAYVTVQGAVDPDPGADPGPAPAPVNPGQGTPSPGAPVSGSPGPPPAAGADGAPAVSKATVSLRPRYALVARGNRIYLRAQGVVSKAQAGRKVAVQRQVGRRMVTISRPRVNAHGRFAVTVRVPRTGPLNVRAQIGSTPTTRAAVSPTTMVRAARSA